MEHIKFELHMQSMHQLCLKTHHPDVTISRLFWLNYTKMIIKTIFSVPLWKQSRLWFYRSKLYLFRPFLFSSKLDHAIPRFIVDHWHPWVWKDQFQFTERSFAACNTYSAIVRIICKAFRSMSGLKDTRHDNFKLHNVKLAFWKLESSRIVAWHLHLNCTQLRNCHT